MFVGIWIGRKWIEFIQSPQLAKIWKIAEYLLWYDSNLSFTKKKLLWLKYEICKSKSIEAELFLIAFFPLIFAELHIVNCNSIVAKWSFTWHLPSYCQSNVLCCIARNVFLWLYFSEYSIYIKYTFLPNDDVHKSYTQKFWHEKKLHINQLKSQRKVCSDGIFLKKIWWFYNIILAKNMKDSYAISFMTCDNMKWMLLLKKGERETKTYISSCWLTVCSKNGKIVQYRISTRWAIKLHHFITCAERSEVLHTSEIKRFVLNLMV